MSREPRPLRTVVRSHTYAGRGSMLGEQGRRRRWWVLTLDCHHEVERDVRYKPHSDRTRGSHGGDGWSLIPMADAIPAPKRARCDHCPPTEETS